MLYSQGWSQIVAGIWINAIMVIVDRTVGIIGGGGRTSKGEIMAQQHRIQAVTGSMAISSRHSIIWSTVVQFLLVCVYLDQWPTMSVARLTSSLFLWKSLHCIFVGFFCLNHVNQLTKTLLKGQPYLSLIQHVRCVIKYSAVVQS